MSGVLAFGAPKEVEAVTVMAKFEGSCAFGAGGWRWMFGQLHFRWLPLIFIDLSFEMIGMIGRLSESSCFCMFLSTRLPSGNKIPVEHSTGLWLFPLCAAVLCRTPLWSTGADLEMQHDATISTISFRAFFFNQAARWCKMMQNV